MTWLGYLMGAILIFFALLIIVVVLLQQGRQANLGAISGAADSFFDKGRARTVDAMLSRWTKFIAVGFFVLCLVGMLLTRFNGFQKKSADVQNSSVNTEVSIVDATKPSEEAVTTAANITTAVEAAATEADVTEEAAAE